MIQMHESLKTIREYLEEMFKVRKITKFSTDVHMETSIVSENEGKLSIWCLTGGSIVLELRGLPYSNLIQYTLRKLKFKSDSDGDLIEEKNEILLVDDNSQVCKESIVLRILSAMQKDLNMDIIFNSSIFEDLRNSSYHVLNTQFFTLQPIITISDLKYALFLVSFYDYVGSSGQIFRDEKAYKYFEVLRLIADNFVHFLKQDPNELNKLERSMNND
jgi:hypothetical protein